MNQLTIPWRLKFGAIVAGYGGVLVVAAALLARRYLAGLQDPDTFSGGMGAGGDWFLELIIVAMFLAPTFLLALFIRDSEAAYKNFAKVLLFFALSLPVSVALMAVPAIGQTNKLPWSLLGYACLYRLFAFPMTFFGFIGCWGLAKFKRPKRLIVYSLGIEIVTIILMFILTSLK